MFDNFNMGEAESFIEALAGSKKARVTFQTFPDRKDNLAGERPRILHGTLEEHANALQELNRRSQGIFVMVNGGDFAGRTAANVTSLRALFVDYDKKDGLPFVDSPLGCSPSILISTANGCHRYFLLRAGQDVADFSEYERALVKYYNGDMAATDISRVLRVPGFYHCKSEPLLVTTTFCVPSRTYSLDEIWNAHRLETLCEKTPQTTDLGEGVNKKQRISLAGAFIEGLEGVPSGGDEKNNRDIMAYRYARDLMYDYLLKNDSDVLDLLTQWNNKNLPPLAISVLKEKIGKARKHPKAAADCGKGLQSSSIFNKKHICCDPVNELVYVAPYERFLDLQGKPTIKVGIAVRGFLAQVRPDIKASDYDCIFSHARFKCCFTLDCQPSKPSVFAQANGSLVFNSYVPPAIKYEQGNYASVERIIMRLTGNDPLALEYVEDWIAYKVQHPEVRSGTALVFTGTSGTGKSTLGQLLMQIIGKENSTIVTAHSLGSKFSLSFADKLFVWADEATTWENQHDGSESLLKTYITNETVVLEGKGRDPYTVANHMSFLFTSNLAHPVNVDQFDRRFNFFDDGLEYNVIRHVDPDYDAFLRSCYDNTASFTPAFRQEIAAFAYAMSVRQVTAKACLPFVNDARTQQIEDNKNSGQLFLDNLPDFENMKNEFLDSLSIYERNALPTYDLSTETEQRLASSMLVSVYQHFCKTQGLKLLTMKTLAPILRKGGYPGARGNRGRYYTNIPFVSGTDDNILSRKMKN